MNASRMSQTAATPTRIERGPFAPLLVALAIAVSLHAAAMLTVVGGGVARWSWQNRETYVSTPSPSAASPVHAPAPVPSPLSNLSKALASISKPEARPIEQRRREAPQKAEQPDIRFGRDHGDPTAIAWIGYDDFQELVARKGRTEQPALQMTADPTPGAPLRTDPTPARATLVAGGGATPSAPLAPPTPPTPSNPPAPPTPPAPASPPPSPAASNLPTPIASGVMRKPAAPPRDEVKPAPPAALTPRPAPLVTTPPENPQPPFAITAPPAATGHEVVVAPEPPKHPDPAPPLPKQSPAPESPPPRLAMAAPRIEPALPDVSVSPSHEPAKNGPTTRPAEPRSTRPSPPPAPAAPTAAPAPGASNGPLVVIPGEGGRPTGSPRSDRESSPVSLTGAELVKVRMGCVLAGEGIEIKTAVPHFSSIALVSSLPANPVVRVVFGKDGVVSEAHITRTSGYPNIDGPILASLYRWRATGQKLAELNRPFEVTILVVLVDD